MSDTPPEKPKRPPAQFLQQNLQGFLQSSCPLPASQPAENLPEGDPPKMAPNFPAALQLRMNQMELANRLKLKGGEQQKAVPMTRGLPPGGFGSAQGIMHLRRGDFGKKPQPKEISEPKIEDQNLESEVEAGGEEVFEVSKDAEFRLDRQGKKPRRFQNPSL